MESKTRQFWQAVIGLGVGTVVGGLIGLFFIVFCIQHYKFSANEISCKRLTVESELSRCVIMADKGSTAIFLEQIDGERRPLISLMSDSENGAMISVWDSYDSGIPKGLHFSISSKDGKITLNSIEGDDVRAIKAQDLMPK